MDPLVKTSCHPSCPVAGPDPGEKASGARLFAPQAAWSALRRGGMDGSKPSGMSCKG